MIMALTQCLGSGGTGTRVLLEKLLHKVLGAGRDVGPRLLLEVWPLLEHLGGEAEGTGGARARHR